MAMQPDTTPSRPAQWFNSVRVRLAFWHAVTLAVLLGTFAMGAYIFLFRSARELVDRSLVETSHMFVAAWHDEQEEEHSTPEFAAREAAREVRYLDRGVLVYDSADRLVAISDQAKLSGELAPSRLARVANQPLAQLVARSELDGPAFQTIGRGDTSIRARAERIVYEGAPYTLVVLQELGQAEDGRKTFATWLIATLPLVILLAGLGGYLLARASLAPVAAMGAQAEQISASNLSARLDVRNPKDELGQLGGVLNRLLSRLEQAFTRQRQFMADASHEMRTPVAIFRSAADIALDQEGQSVDELRDTLRVVSAEGRRLTQIVDDLFLLARADSGQQPIRHEWVFLEEVLADAAAAGRALGRPRGVAVMDAPADEAPFLGDPALLGRLLLNLVDNAVKHTPAGGEVRLALTVTHSATFPDGVRLPGPWYRITVEDTGSGVSPSVRDTLFERFVRAENNRKTESTPEKSGAGLGLAIARWIADAHGGHVVLEATGVGGSRFAVWLPAHSLFVDGMGSEAHDPGSPLSRG